ncbi:MAG TPA: hypothetical protein VM734_26350 [Kofleriaceae bacterium]|nr:hypothetical protein [Kofleriaceae bacterium]
MIADALPARAVAASPPAVADVPAGFALVDQLLRDRAAVLARIRAGVGLAAVVRTAALVIVAGATIYGAALGSFRGGVQIGYAAVKLPLVLLATAALGAPVLTAVGRALGRPASLARDVALIMTALALGALTLVALGPVVLVARALDVDYHGSILLAVATAAVAGGVSVAVLAAGVGAVERRDAGVTVAVVVCVFAAVGAQVAWTLRPYLVRPRTPEVPFVRAIEGSLYDAIAGSVRSARGDYRRESAPLPPEASAASRVLTGDRPSPASGEADRSTQPVTESVTGSGARP